MEKTYKLDRRWLGAGKSIVVEVIKTNSVRDVRSTFLALAYCIETEPKGSKALCLILATRLSQSRLQGELRHFRQVIKPSLANRVHFLTAASEASQNEPAFVGSLENEPLEFYSWLTELASNEKRVAYGANATQLPARQVVVAALAQYRLSNKPSVTVKHLQEQCQVSYPTVALVLKDLGDRGWLEDSAARGVRLRRLTTSEWMELAREHARQRKVYLFADPTGLSAPQKLIRRFIQLQNDGKIPSSARIGGVAGAAMHFPPLDITAPPRLDLSIDGSADALAKALDAGLRPKNRPEQKVVLVIHVTRMLWANEKERVQPWAGQLECLADLIEIGLNKDATEMAQYMSKL